MVAVGPSFPIPLNRDDDHRPYSPQDALWLHLGVPVVLVAHRAAEVPAVLTAAADVADIVELDVHLFRGRLEVRHAKVIWPLAWRWDRWYLVPRGSPRPTLEDVIAFVRPETELWIDLKGFSRRLTARVVDAVADRPRTTVSSRSWWILPRRQRQRNLRIVHSVGSRFQLWLLARRPPNSLESVAVDRRLADRPSIIGLHRVAPLVFVWGIRDVKTAVAAVEAGADGLIVDGIDTIVRLCERFVSSRDARSADGARTLTATPPFD